MAAAALVILVGIWAGIRVHSSWRAPARTGAIAIPVGEASPPTPSDLVDQPKAGLAGPDVQIPERLPAFALQDLGGTLTPIDHLEGEIPGDQFLGNLVRAVPARNSDAGPPFDAMGRSGRDRDRHRR